MSTRQSTKQTKKVAPQFDLGFVPTDERQINYEGTKELDPIADRDMRLEELSFIASQKKKLTEEENKLKNSFELFSSKFPDGSSAIIIFGELINALPIAIR